MSLSFLLCEIVMGVLPFSSSLPSGAWEGQGAHLCKVAYISEEEAPIFNSREFL